MRHPYIFAAITGGTSAVIAGRLKEDTAATISGAAALAAIVSHVAGKPDLSRASLYVSLGSLVGAVSR